MGIQKDFSRHKKSPLGEGGIVGLCFQEVFIPLSPLSYEGGFLVLAVYIHVLWKVNDATLQSISKSG